MFEYVERVFVTVIVNKAISSFDCLVETNHYKILQYGFKNTEFRENWCKVFYFNSRNSTYYWNRLKLGYQMNILTVKCSFFTSQVTESVFIWLKNEFFLNLTIMLPRIYRCILWYVTHHILHTVCELYLEKDGPNRSFNLDVFHVRKERCSYHYFHQYSAINKNTQSIKHEINIQLISRL